MFPGKKTWLRTIWLLIPVMILSFTIAQAQQLTATLSGTVTDQTDAHVAGAKVKVINDATGDTRDSKADSAGFFAVTALIPGTYTVEVSAKGFASWKETGILLNQGDSRAIPAIHLKIGTETTSDIHDILFERCHILTSSRGLTIQLRDEGSVFRVRFQDIQFISRYYSEPWWGRGEAVSLTAFPRAPAAKIGSLHDITLQNITGRAENSVRVQGTPASPVHDVLMDSLDLSLSRWTKYPGGVFDNRPTSALEQVETHGTPGFSIRDARDITLKNCAVHWESSAPDHYIPAYFSNALEAENTHALRLTGFKGEAAHPDREDAVVIH